VQKIKFIILGIIIVAGATTLVVQHKALIALREENESLRKQLEQIDTLKTENESLSNLLAQANASINEPSDELLKLRGEVGTLRNQMDDLAKELRTETNAVAELRRKNLQLFSALPIIHSPLFHNDVDKNGNAVPNLGAVEFVNQVPVRFDLGSGSDCVIFPTLVDSSGNPTSDGTGDFDLAITFESVGTDGQIKRGAARVITSPGHPVQMTSGDFSIALNPTFAQPQ
jgi:predicted nuclease with TOPRIM domain